MDFNNIQFNPRTLVTSPNFIFRFVSILFAIIILACIDRDGYFAGKCLFYSGGNACSFSLTVASLGFIFCCVFIVVDALFLSIKQNYRRLVTIVDLGFSAFWAFMYFVLFCYMANHWQNSEATPKELEAVNVNNIRASIAFAFFSIFSWVGMAFVAYRRFASLETYNQYADDMVNGGGRGDMNNSGDLVGTGGYIDYFNQPSTPVHTGFDAVGGGNSSSADDEFIAGGRPEQLTTRAGDSELLTS